MMVNVDRCGNIDKSVDLFQLIFPEKAIRSMLGMSPSLAIAANLYAVMMKGFQYVRPNTRSFNIFLKAIREHRRAEGEAEFPGATMLNICYRLLQKMKELKISPDAVTINTIVDIAVVEGQLEQAEEVSHSS
jgi:hypothetical protein